MRIIMKECRKILDLRVLAVIAVFTFLFYRMFMEYAFSVNEWWSDAVFSLREELMEEVGATLVKEELPALYGKRQELVSKIDGHEAAKAVMEEAGVRGFEELAMLYYEAPGTNGKISDLWFRAGEVTEYIRQVEDLDDLAARCLYEGDFSVPPQDAERIIRERYGAIASPLFVEATTRFCRREQSMLPHSVLLRVLWPDMRKMTVLLVICNFLLLVPYQVHERLRGVLPLYAATRTGRRIFRKQFWAGLISCGILCAVQLAVYSGVFMARGLGAFWKCPAWSDTVTATWFPFSFGAYMAVYLLMAWLFAMGGGALAYCIGRWASNYVAGIAAAIPMGGAACWIGQTMLHSVFWFYLDVRMPLWEIPALAVWLSAAGCLAALVFGNDKRRGL